MKPVLESLVDRIVVRSPAQTLFGRRARSKLAVLAYHSVDDPERFAMQMEVVTRAAHPVSLDIVLDAQAGRRPLPDRAVLVTFDDADATVAAHASRILAERRIPAVAFVVASALDTDRPLWPAEARDLIRHGGVADDVAGLDADAAVRRMKRLPDDRRLAVLASLRASATAQATPAAQLSTHDLAGLQASGIEVGNHTMTHPCLDRCSDEIVAREIAVAHRTLTAAGVAPRAFAYPNGDTDARVMRIVAEHGYDAAFLFDHRLNEWPLQDRLSISRLRVNASDTIDRFRAVLSGLHPAFLALRTRSGGRAVAAESAI